MSVPGDYFVEITKDGVRHYFRRRLDRMNVEKISAEEWNKWVLHHPQARWATMSTTKPIQVRYYKANISTPYNPVRMGDYEVSEAEFFAGTPDNARMLELLLSLYLQQLAVGSLLALGQTFPLRPSMLEIGKDRYFVMNDSSEEHCIETAGAQTLAWGREKTSFKACIGEKDCRYMLQVHPIASDRGETIKQREVLMERLQGSIPPLKKQWACYDTPKKGAAAAGAATRGYKHYMLFYADGAYQKFEYKSKTEAEQATLRMKMLELFEKIHLQRVTINLGDLAPDDFVMKDGEIYLWNIVNCTVHDLPQGSIGLDTFHILKNESETNNYSQSVMLDMLVLYTRIFEIDNPTKPGFPEIQAAPKPAWD